MIANLFRYCAGGDGCHGNLFLFFRFVNEYLTKYLEVPLWYQFVAL